MCHAMRPKRTWLSIPFEDSASKELIEQAAKSERRPTATWAREKLEELARRRLATKAAQTALNGRAA